MNDTMINLTPLVEAVIAVLAMVISTYLIPWLKVRMSNEQLEKVYAIVDVGVYAAEKLYGAGHGDDKLAYVKEFLAARGVELDTAQLKVFVDSAIKRMEQSEKHEVVKGELLTTEGDEEPQAEV